MKIIITLIVLLIISFGCTTSQTTTSEDFVNLQNQYNVKEVFDPDLGVMNSYITDLSLIRAQTVMPLSKIVDVELYSAQSFYYLSKAFKEASGIDYSGVLCNSQEYKNTLKYLKLSKNMSQKANAELVLVLPTDSHLLKENQSQIINGFYVSADEYNMALEELC
jgi:hypothetical protein